MNNVCITGRLTREPETRTTNDGLSIASFTVACNRTKKGEADFISCKAFGKTAELIESYFHKGKEIGVSGRIQTGSYEKDGIKHYTTDVIAERIDFIGSKGSDTAEEQPSTVSGFSLLEDDLPF